MIALLLASILAVQPSQREVGVMVFGPTPGPSCGQWTEARVYRGNAVAEQYTMWLLGFVSGMNWALADTRGDVARTVDTQGILGWIDQYCRNNPLQTLIAAALELDKELARRSRSAR